MTKRIYKDIRRVRWWNQKDNARKRNIEWTLTFDEWWHIWETSGHWENRGRKQGQYCMSRLGDSGPYAVGNVFIQLHGQNVSDAWIGQLRGPQSEEHRTKLRLAKQKSPN